MRLIDVDAFLERNNIQANIAELVNDEPTIDAVKVVRCVNCEHYRKDRRINCVFHLSSVRENWFCSEGK